jgi:hypothetical protein
MLKPTKYKFMKRLRLLFVSCFFLFSFQLFAQQNLTMYFVHSNPEVNSLNPAFQNTCKLFIGLPVISSIHTNFNSDGFSYRDAFQKEGSNYYIVPSKMNMGKVSSLNGEFYTNLIAVGLWVKKNYFTFSVIEKTDFASFLHKDLFGLVFEGNSQYIGENAKLKRSGLFFDYRREYAFGVARKINPDLTLGIKGKLLFGKINLSSRRSNTFLYTDPNTYALTANSDFTINSSAPMDVATNASGRFTGATYTGSPMGILFNRSNIGLALDLGFIQKISDQETVSGSILDLGAIYYTSSPNNYHIVGDYTYTGQSATTNSLREIVDSAFNSFNATVERNSYMAFLPPRLYLNYEYKFTPKTNLNALVSAKIYRYKILPAYTVGATHQLIKGVHLAASWSYFNRTFKNIGTGLVLGNHPIQFYAFTDNILTAFDPLASRSLNLRFGINLIFGCKKRDNFKKGGCEWMRKADKKNERLLQLLNK